MAVLQDRRGRCPSDMDRQSATRCQVRCGQDRGAAGRTELAPRSCSADEDAHHANERTSRPSVRVRHRSARWASSVLVELPDALAQAEARLPAMLVESLREQLGRVNDLERDIATIERRLSQQLRTTPACQTVAETPGLGLMTATAIVASMGSPTAFRDAREFAAWIGLVPRANRHWRASSAAWHQPAGRRVPAHAAHARSSVDRQVPSRSGVDLAR